MVNILALQQRCRGWKFDSPILVEIVASDIDKGCGFYKQRYQQNAIVLLFIFNYYLVLNPNDG